MKWLVLASALSAGCGARSELTSDDGVSGSLAVSQFWIDCFPTGSRTPIDHIELAATIRVETRERSAGPFDLEPAMIADVDRRVAGTFTLAPSTVPALGPYERTSVDVTDEALTFEGTSTVGHTTNACMLCPPFTSKVVDLRVVLVDRASGAVLELPATRLALECSS